MADTSNRVAIPNAAVRDNRLSFTARGVLALILSRQDQMVDPEWIARQSAHDDSVAVAAAIAELRMLGYLVGLNA